MTQIDSIIFDLDGTLVDSREDIVNAVNYTLISLGLEKKTFEKIVSYIGTGINDLLNKSIGLKNKDHFSKALSVYQTYYKKHSADFTRPYPNVIDVLEYYKNKDLSIVTNRRVEMAEVTVKSLKLDKYFRAIVGDDGKGCLKPLTCSLDKVMDGYNTDKQKILMVGDMDIDVLAGKNMDVITCAVTYGIGKREDLVKAKPDFMISDIVELKSLFS